MTDILIVEDENVVAMEIQDRLENFGYNVAGFATSGEEAIKKAEVLSPDLVLMDVMLKGKMDGVEAAEMIRACFDIPVIFLTAFSDEDTLQRAKMTKPFGYLIKPFDERELRSTIEIAMYKHEMEKKLKESGRWYMATLNSIADAVIATDENGLVKFMNPFAEALTGWKMEEAIKKPVREVFHIISEETGLPVEDPVKKAIDKGVFFGLADQTLLVSKEKTQIPVDIIGTPIRDIRDNVMGIVLIFYSITDRKQIEEEFIENSKKQPG